MCRPTYIINVHTSQEEFDLHGMDVRLVVKSTAAHNPYALKGQQERLARKKKAAAAISGGAGRRRKRDRPKSPLALKQKKESVSSSS